MRASHRPAAAALALLLAAAAAACGGGGDTDTAADADVARAGAPAEDGDSPTPAPPLPEAEQSCAAPAGTDAARVALGSLPATATLDRVGPTPPPDLAAAGRETVRGTVTGVEVGARSEATMGDYVAALGDAPLAILTVDLVLSVDRGSGAGRSLTAGERARVPLVVHSAGPQPDDQLALIEDQARHDLACAVRGVRVALLATGVTPRTGRAAATVALPRLLWATDPAAIAIGSPGGIVSADPLIDPAQAPAYYGAPTLDRVSPATLTASTWAP